jgi:hypothetical protein
MCSATAGRTAPLLFLFAQPGIDTDLPDPLQVVQNIDVMSPFVPGELADHITGKLLTKGTALRAMCEVA